MPSGGLPPGFDLLFNSDEEAAGRVLDVDLPPGRLVEPQEEEDAWDGPAYWLSNEPVGPDLWVQLHRAHARSGLWPVFADSSFHDERPWLAGEVSPQPVADIARVKAGDVLAAFWGAWVRGEHHLCLESDSPLAMASAFTVARQEGFGELEPFGQGWPGLAPAVGGTSQDPDQFADRYLYENDDGTSRIMLVPAARGADVMTAVGWYGAVNYIQEKFLLSCVVRSWEDRFGARLIAMGFDTLHLAVANPPVAAEHAELVAAEHFAFCPDILEVTPTIRDYAAQAVREKAVWRFWWD